MLVRGSAVALVVCLGCGGTVVPLLGDSSDASARTDSGGVPDVVAVDSTADVTNGDGACVSDDAGAVCFQCPIDSVAGLNPQVIAPGDFDGDGKLDVAVSIWGSAAIAILLGNGDGTFQAPTNIPLVNGPFTVAAGDFNSDGRSNLATGLFGGDLDVFLGNGHGKFKLGWTSTLPGGGAMGIAVADFNGDGKVDLATADTAGVKSS